MENTKNIKDVATPSTNDYSKIPIDSFDLINKYGRCNVQATADTDNPFPHIAQGLPTVKNRAKRSEEKKTREDAF